MKKDRERFASEPPVDWLAFASPMPHHPESVAHAFADGEPLDRGDITDETPYAGLLSAGDSRDPEVWEAAAATLHRRTINPGDEGIARLCLMSLVAAADRESRDLARWPRLHSNEVPLLIFGHPLFPAHAMRGMHRHADSWFRACVVGDPRVPPAVLRALAQDRDELVGVRMAIFGPAWALKYLAAHPVESVRREAVLSAQASEALSAFASDPSTSLRALVACDENTPTVWVEKLAKDPSAKVREHVAKNIAAPPWLLARLALHYTPAVRLAAVETILWQAEYGVGGTILHREHERMSEDFR